MLSLSGPLLGAVVGATAGLLLVIFVIVLAVKLRYRPRSQEDSHDDGGMANLAASGTGASSPRDKSSTLPLSTDSIESFEKNPDIIPHANGKRENLSLPDIAACSLIPFIRGLCDKRVYISACLTVARTNRLSQIFRLLTDEILSGPRFGLIFIF